MEDEAPNEVDEFRVHNRPLLLDEIDPIHIEL
jgi:hypothetical protein